MSKGKYKRKKQHGQKHTQQNAANSAILGERMDPKSEAEAGAERKNETKCKEEQRMGLGERIKRSSVTDWLLALFTAVLATAAIYQFTIVGSQLDVMRKDQRAWIVVAEKIGTTIAVNATPSTSISITNTGRTPATDVVGHFYVEVVPNGESPHFEAQAPHSIVTYGVALPNMPQEIPVVRRRSKVGGDLDEGENAPLTESEKAALVDGKSWVAVHGIVWYDDVFHKNRHWIKFCFWGDLKPGIYSARGCTAYNSVDEK